MISSDPFWELPKRHFGALVADPPWPFRNWSAKGEHRNALQHYDVLTLPEICALPVASLCADAALLIMWVTDTTIERAFEVLHAWGFEYKTIAYHWVKTNRDGTFFTGMGYWTRANPEMALLATRGKPSRQSTDVPRLIIAPRREHSRKPDEVYWRTRRLTDGPYLDLFSRERRKHWSSWGNETTKFNISPETERWI